MPIPLSTFWRSLPSCSGSRMCCLPLTITLEAWRPSWWRSFPCSVAASTPSHRRSGLLHYFGLLSSYRLIRYSRLKHHCGAVDRSKRPLQLEGSYFYYCTTLSLRSFKIHVWNDHGWFENHPVVIGTCFCWLNLFSEIRHVIREAEEVFFELVWAGLTGHGQRACRIIVSERAQTLYFKDVVTCDAVVEHNAPVDLELVGGFRQVL